MCGISIQFFQMERAGRPPPFFLLQTRRELNKRYVFVKYRDVSLFFSLSTLMSARKKCISTTSVVPTFSRTRISTSLDEWIKPLSRSHFWGDGINLGDVSLAFPGGFNLADPKKTDVHEWDRVVIVVAPPPGQAQRRSLVDTPLCQMASEHWQVL